jgi:hypothetical protein
MSTATTGTHAVPKETTGPVAERGSDGFVRKAGRDLLLSIYGALRTVKLYPPDNPVVQKTMDEIVRLAQDFLKREHELELRVSGEFLFVNSTRLRLDLDNYASFNRILTVFREAGVGLCRIREDSAARDWVVFLNLIQSANVGEADGRLYALAEKMAGARVMSIEIGPPSEVDEAIRQKSKEAAKRTYSQSVSVTKEVINSVRMGKSPNIKKIKRVVQGIVDQILNEETSLIGLTTLRDYDEYTFTHSVNVCIFSVALGRKLGLSRLQL